MRKFTGPLLAALLVFAPAALAGETATQPEKTCLFSNRVDGYTKANRDSIVLTSGLDKWRADFANSCTNIQFAEEVGVDSHTTCVTPGDSIRFRDTGNIRTSCMIKAVTYLPKEQKAAAPASN
ncbi:MAG: hypothetical protein IT548_06500 [Alphaproteobacteria bacterium]|nr:hypothetical protein [Alphaproteobacteria bacterium]